MPPAGVSSGPVEAEGAETAWSPTREWMTRVQAGREPGKACGVGGRPPSGWGLFSALFSLGSGTQGDRMLLLSAPSPSLLFAFLTSEAAGAVGGAGTLPASLVGQAAQRGLCCPGPFFPVLLPLHVPG